MIWLKRLKILFSALTMLASDVCIAANLPQHDFQFWGNVTAIGPMSGSVRYWLEGQGRFGDDATRISQLLVRPGIGYALNDTSSIWLGYAYINTQFPFTRAAVDENRIWQQFLWINNYSWGRAISRTRLEQRFIESVTSTGWRFRQFARIERAFEKNSKAFVAIAEELFVQLNNTRIQGSNTGFDQNRIFIGLGYLPTRNVLFEVGYQNQYIRRINDSNYMGNYLASNLIFNF